MPLSGAVAQADAGASGQRSLHGGNGIAARVHVDGDIAAAFDQVVAGGSTSSGLMLTLVNVCLKRHRIAVGIE